MPTREIIGKSIAFAVAAGGCIASGVLVLSGPHAYNDYFNAGLGWGLIAFGVMIAGLGGLVIVGIVVEARVKQRETRLRVTPRPGALGPPPAWGMGDIGRIDKIVRVGGDHEAMPTGGGGVRVVSATMASWDAPLLIVAAFIWTTVFTIWLAPH